MMSASSSETVPKNGNKVQQVDNACKPEWLDAFLSKNFFDSCKTHPPDKNELNRYCINCDLAACKYCALSSTHHKHAILQIYRLCYKDAVPLAAMEKHINCSQIQTYKRNNHTVIALKPLPHAGSEKLDKASTCDICSRVLAEPDSYRYCSISCKVEAVSRKPNDSVPPFISIQSRPQETKEGTTGPGKQLNKEKEETTEFLKQLNKEKEETNEHKEKEEETNGHEEKEEETTEHKEKEEETTEPRLWLNKEKEETTEPTKRLNKEKEETAEPLNKEMQDTMEPPEELNEEKGLTTEPPERKHRRKEIPHRAPFF